MKKSICILLAFVLVVSIFPIVCGQETDLQDGGFKYQIVNGGAVVTWVATSDDNVIVPSALGGYPVVAIGEEAIRDHDRLTTITLPDTVIAIGKNAFKNSSALKTVNLPNGLKTIEDGAFSECMALEQITIPASVESIGNGVFTWCGKMTEIKVEADSNYFTSIDGVLFDKKAETLIAYPRAKQADYVVPDGVKEIRPYAFSSVYGLTGVTLPDSLTKLGEHAFDQCSGLAGTVIVPAGVTVIEPYSFYNCKKLEAVALPNGLLTIGQGAFLHSDLADIAIPATVTSIGAEAFSNTGIRIANIPKGVKVIGDNAFSVCDNLTEVTLAEGIEHIGKRAFYYSPRICSIDLPASIRSLGEQAFAPCRDLESITISPENLYYTSVDGVLYSKDMTRLVAYPTNKQQEEYTIPATVTRMEHSACYGALFTKITLPQGLTWIDDDVFHGCDFSQITLPASLLHIGNYAFYGCENLTHIDLPDSVTELGEDLFFGCTALQTVDLPQKLTVLPSGMFTYCSALTHIELPANLTTMGTGVFNGCTSLRQVVIPKGVAAIAPWCFENCNDLTVFAENVISIGDHAFHGCHNITLIVSDKLKTIVGGAFYWADGVIKGNAGSFAHRYVQEQNQYGDYSINFEPLVGIAFDKSQFALQRGQSVLPRYKVTDQTKPIIWESSDPDVAVVKDGVVTAVFRGMTKITAQVEIGGKMYRDTCLVYVDRVGLCDMDGDWKTTAADALAVLKHVVRKQVLTQEQQEEADLDEDGRLTSNDALMILKIVVGKL
ncbi:MAG: leucine-rich repeat protein [Clostridia bacterium]|nr:leucine-rich repeat protein [Clostridia bacterium]